MADKGIVDLIKKHEDERAANALDAAMHVLDDPSMAGALAAALGTLVEDLRTVADLYVNAKVKGGLSLSKEYRQAAAKIELTRRAMATLGPGDMMREPAPIGRTGDSESLKTFVAESAERGLGSLREHAAPSIDSTVSYLKGESDILPGYTVPVPEAPVFMDPTPLDQIPSMATRGTAPDFSDPIPSASMPNFTEFLDPAPLPSKSPGSEWVPPSLRNDQPVTWERLAELSAMGPEELGLPAHLSHSQMNTLGSCGTQYLLQRSERAGVRQVPQWALIGGKAFHAFAESFERLVAEVKREQYVRDRMKLAGGVGGVWRKALTGEIAEAALSGVPMDDWRASNKGKENYTWWLVEGESMCERYADMRLGEIADKLDRSIAKMPDGAPMIEHEYAFAVVFEQIKGVIDQVWIAREDWADGPHAGDLIIDDLKSGGSMPNNTGQLGEYAQAITSMIVMSELLVTEGAKLWGRFYDARRGTYSAPVELLQRHPRAELEFKVDMAARQKRAGIYTPNASPFCNGCSVKHACPIFALAPAQVTA